MSEFRRLDQGSASLTVIVDGSTLQKSADVLLDNPTTAGHRHMCRESYLHSLVDLTTALISGSRLAVVNMPDYAKDVHPGNTLVKEWFAELFENVERTGTFTYKTIFDDDKSLNEISPLISRLRLDSLGSSRSLWKELMIREVTLDLGDHPSLTAKLKNREEYEFRRDRFRRVPELQNAVPSAFVAAMIDDVRKAKIIPEQVTSEALEEFISLIAVAHIGNYVWYRHLSRSLTAELGQTLLIPHCTRQALLRVNSRLFTDAGENIRELLMPSILGPILEEAKEKSDPRIATLKLLQRRVQDNSFKWLREDMAQVIHQLDRHNDGEDCSDRLNELVEEIRLKSKEGGPVERWKLVKNRLTGAARQVKGASLSVLGVSVSAHFLGSPEPGTFSKQEWNWKKLKSAASAFREFASE